MKLYISTEDFEYPSDFAILLMALMIMLIPYGYRYTLLWKLLPCMKENADTREMPQWSLENNGSTKNICPECGYDKKNSGTCPNCGHSEKAK